jgi:hypothetical protein
MTIPAVFIYLDEGGIQSLLAQTVERLEVESTKSSERSRENKAAARGSLGNIAALFGLNLGVDVGRAISRKDLDDAKFIVTTEQRLAKLITFLSKEGELYEKLEDAIERASALSSTTFFIARITVDAPQFYSDDGAEIATKKGRIEFVAMPSSARIVMIASLSKFPIVPAGRLENSQLGFTLAGGKDKLFTVFGALWPISGGFQIKPYAILF